MKDQSKGNEASNYRPINCLPLFWKFFFFFFTGMISENIYTRTDNQNITARRTETLQEEGLRNASAIKVDKTVLN